MEIGVVCHPVFGGSGVVATELAKNLQKRGYKVHLVCYKEPVRLCKEDGILFHKVHMRKYPLFPHPFYTLDLAAKIQEILSKYPIKLLHAHYAIPHTISCFLAKELGRRAKIITTLHGTDIYIFGEELFYKSMLLQAVERSDGVTAVSYFLKEKTSQMLNSSKNIRVIPNFVDHERFCREKGFDERVRRTFAEDDEALLLHVSNFRPVKRVPYIVEVFSFIKKKRVKAKLLLVGDGPQLAESIEKAKQLGISDSVHFLGTIRKVERLFCVADLLLNLSSMESFCLAALEALSCKVPVVATRVGGLPEVVEDGVCGYLVDDDVYTIVDACIQILKNRRRRETFGQKGREIVMERFCAQKIVPLYEGFYEEVMEGC
jgi:N-acetyl-alpha-D-glucosaminyl L-malate synthase BshA